MRTNDDTRSLPYTNERARYARTMDKNGLKLDAPRRFNSARPETEVTLPA